MHAAVTCTDLIELILPTSLVNAVMRAQGCVIPLRFMMAATTKAVEISIIFIQEMVSNLLAQDFYSVPGDLITKDTATTYRKKGSMILILWKLVRPTPAKSTLGPSVVSGGMTTI